MMHTLRFTLRSLRGTPLFTLAVIGILALGLGATTAITSIVDTVLLRPLPFADPEGLVVVWESRPEVGPDNYLVTPADYFDWKGSENEPSEVFVGLSAYTESFFNLEPGPGSEWPERLAGLVASPDLLEVLGVVPRLGRGLVAADAAPDAADVVVVSHGFWQRRLGGMALRDDTTVTLDGTVATVVGVLDEDFLFLGKRFDILAVYAPSSEGRVNRQAHFLTVIGRLAPAVSLEQAQDALDRQTTQLAETFPDTNTGHGARLVPLRDELVGGVETALRVLLLAVACVLAITYANVANLLLARGATRNQELAVRSALGATRGRLIGQLLIEGLILGLLGGLGGLLVARLGIDGLRALTPVDVPRFDTVALDWRLFAFAFLLSVVSGLIRAR